MKNGENVVEMAAHRPPFLPPAHFKKTQKATWDELVGASAVTLHVPENRFTFEIAATLLSRFRAGRSMTVAELKDMHRYMAALGLALADDTAAGPRKPNKLDKYVR